MYKTLTTLFAILLFPVLLFAQEDNVLKDFANGVNNIASLQINDHLNVLQVSYTNNTFDLEGINDQMQIVWKINLKGHPIKTTKLKGNIVTIAATDFNENSAATTNTYNAFLLEPASGKLLIQQQIYTNSDDFVEHPEVSTEESELLKIMIRTTDEKRLNYKSLASLLKPKHKTTDLQVLEINDKLEIVKSFKAIVQSGIYLKTAWNKEGDMFTAWLNGPTIEFYKYEKGKTEPSGQLNEAITFNEKKEDKEMPDENILLTTDENNSNVIYYCMIYDNNNKDPELGVGKFDFSNSQKLFITEPLDKKSLKAIYKAYIPVNKKLDDPYLESSGSTVRYINEKNGRLIVALSANFIIQAASYDMNYVTQNLVKSDTYAMAETSYLINGYDSNLNMKYQQIMPTKYSNTFMLLPGSFKIKDNTLFIACNYQHGIHASEGVMGSLNTETGIWDKMDILPKLKTDGTPFLNGNGVMWFGNNYIVSYFTPHTFGEHKYHLSLQLDQY